MLTIRAIKLYADGALGSRGALLLRRLQRRAGPPRTAGHLGRAPARGRAPRRARPASRWAPTPSATRPTAWCWTSTRRCSANCRPPTRRWRIEHAQILDPADIPRFAALGVIAAMQPVHCTSDMDWADERLGDERLAGAYAWRSLLDSGAHLCFGTDFPVEKVEPPWRVCTPRARARTPTARRPAAGSPRRPGRAHGPAPLHRRRRLRRLPGRGTGPRGRRLPGRPDGAGRRPGHLRAGGAADDAGACTRS